MKRLMTAEHTEKITYALHDAVKTIISKAQVDEDREQYGTYEREKNFTFDSYLSLR